ncbi:integrase core domain-containing protein [Vibrio cyclitrophicus]|uniref:integrase core domain-containing protein n=1 Tax=Vibrio cyclitrophicus TaxID=47951 RepID=UPI0003002E53|nr:transposase [Vibrio cyclitrophicus 1F53]OEF46055.1 transposase [Vibrio cyclitrophicus 1F273]OEF66722.1 transposase [Vibrio cyclitrophicus 1F175]PMH36244.1 transposase [Vibrio cyclitrophicus]PMH71667.1 transposase [Vibrio cyclitrophicus]
MKLFVADHPYVESLFRTVKYMPNWPTKGFESLDSSRSWVEAFVLWYNTEHKHSKLNYVTPSERHNGKDKEILKRRVEVLFAAKQRKPERWSGDIRNCAPVGDVHLNPEREAA